MIFTRPEFYNYVIPLMEALQVAQLFYSGIFPLLPCLMLNCNELINAPWRAEWQKLTVGGGFLLATTRGNNEPINHYQKKKVWDASL